MKRIVLTLSIIALICATACNNNQKKTSCQESNDAVKEIVANKETKETKTGTFTGTMPAADCEGIRTILVVNSDSTYTLKEEYIGVENGIFETSGIYNQLGNGLIELITPSSGEKTYFIEVETGFMLSDSLGTINQGELAEYYILKQE